MKKLTLGMKIYSYDWYWKYGLDYDKAALLLKNQGVDFVIVQNEYIPSMNTAAKAEVPPEQQERFSSYDDRKFRQALRNQGIDYWASSLMFFNPREVELYGNYPVDINGNVCEKEDWYLGACPSNDNFVSHRIEQIVSAVRALEPDGVFLGFMRFPGFWETWLPGTVRKNWKDCCFCDNCIKKFESWSGIAIPEKAPSLRGKWIKDNCFRKYSQWKAFRLREIILEIREKTDDKVKIMLNTLPFDRKRFGDAGTEVFGQSIEILSDVVDVFEVMAYHQILGLPGEWAAEAAADIKIRTKSNNEVLCTVQGKPDYTQGMHSGRGRKEDITLDEVSEIITKVKSTGKADGIVVYSWADFLEHQFEQNTTEYIDRIKKSLRENT